MLIRDLLPDLRIMSPVTGDITVRLVVVFVMFVEVPISDDSTR